MTNSIFTVAMLVLWSTNTYDTLLTPAGDRIIRNTVTFQTHVYTVPGQASVTNVVAVATNSIHLQLLWVPYVPTEFPPVPVMNQKPSVK